MKKKKIFAVCLALIIMAFPTMNGTLAYFADTDSAVNVMTLGSVQIVQIEQQRKLNADETLAGLEAFQQNKSLQPTLAPATYKTYTPDLSDAYWFSANASGVSLPNPIDKIVTVRNDGNINAYVRTVFAFEAPAGFNLNADDSAAGWNILYNSVANATVQGSFANSDWKWTFFDADARFTMADGQKYVIAVATSQKPLAPGATTIPNLLQYYLNSKTTQEDVENMGGSVTIYAFTQGVQADGFSSADVALKEAFGGITYDAQTGKFTNLPWSNTAPGGGSGGGSN